MAKFLDKVTKYMDKYPKNRFLSYIEPGVTGMDKIPTINMTIDKYAPESLKATIRNDFKTLPLSVQADFFKFLILSKGFSFGRVSYIDVFPKPFWKAFTKAQKQLFDKLDDIMSSPDREVYIENLTHHFAIQLASNDSSLLHSNKYTQSPKIVNTNSGGIIMLDKSFDKSHQIIVYDKNVYVAREVEGDDSKTMYYPVLPVRYDAGIYKAN